MDTKTCSKCGEIHPVSQFRPRKATKDGLGSHCKPCLAIKAREARLANPEKAKQMKLRYRINNPDKVKAARRESHEKNKDRDLARARQYKAENAEALAISSAEYRKSNPEFGSYARSLSRARTKNAFPAWADKEKIREFYIEAERLDALLGIPHDVDHIVPLTSKIVCGLHCEANLQVLTKAENKAKYNRHWPDMP